EQDNSFATQVVFPNPATDQLYFKKESKFEIMDIQGRVLLKNEKFVQSVNVNHLKAGIYFIKFEDNRVEKFVKK
ncbi:MAG: T9SS type A sorting domain-containing protein, partial [Spirochaetaceae bacterium]|nr:T9SS type A sorting domain-containing protein [Spirochaetaceae bacterium]